MLPFAPNVPVWRGTGAGAGERWMFDRWHGLSLQSRFMAITGAGVLGLAVCTVAAVGWWQSERMEAQMRGFSENELKSLHALVLSSMAKRRDDPGNIGVAVFNSWFESRNADYPGKLWSVWGGKLTEYMGVRFPAQPPKAPLDDIDREVLRTGQPVGRMVGGAYRYSVPIVLGVTQGTNQPVCHACHGRITDEADGDVIAVFSSSLSTAAEQAALHRMLLLMAGAGLAAALVVTLAIRAVFARVISRPLARMTGAMAALAGGDRAAEVPFVARGDDIGAMARTVAVFKDGLVRAHDLTEKEHRDQAAKDQRGRVVDNLIRMFNEEVGAVLGTMASSATELEATSQSMSATASATY